MKRNKVILFLIIAIISLISAIGIGYSGWQIILSVESDNIVNKQSVCYNLTKSKYFTSVEKALDIAESGDILYLIPGTKDNYTSENKVQPDRVEYTINRDCEIKSGVTLILPTDNKELSNVTNATTLNDFIVKMYTADVTNTSTSHASQNPNSYLRCTLNVADNVTLTNNGKLVVSGYLSAGNSGTCTLGHTAYSYAQIKLGKNSKILQNDSSAVTYCFGYIQESAANNSSNVEIKSGTLYVPFVLNDYRGFNVSWAMTDGAIDKEGCSAFNQFELRNISSKTTIRYGANVSSYVNVLVKYTNPSVNQAFSKEIKLIGKDTSYFLQLTDSQYSYIDYKYNNTTSQAKIDIYGGAALNSIALTLKASIVTVDLSTTNAYFPISYRFNVDLYQNPNQTEVANFDLTKQRTKLLPGSKLTVNGNCKVIANEITSYTAFYDGSKGNSESSSNAYNAVAYPVKEGAQFILKDNANLTATKLAGTIYKSDTANVSYTTDTITTKEAWQTKSSGKVSPAWTIGEYLEIKEKLNMVSLDNLNKTKLYVAMNTFTNYNSFLPSINVNIDNIPYTVDTYQTVIFLDTINSYTVDFNKNIYKVKYGASGTYKMNSSINYSISNSIVCAINSVLSVENNITAGGINEFEAQSITLSCITPLVNGQIPLYVDSQVQLEADVVDINKIYDKTITWWSSDNNIATVDQGGYVTGVSLGKVIIYAKCNNVQAEMELEVLEGKTIAVDSIEIEDNTGYSTANAIKTINKVDYHGEYGNKKTITFTLKITPSDANWTSIKWTYSSPDKRSWLVDKNGNQIENTIEGVTTVYVYTSSGTQANDDLNTLTVVVNNDEKLTKTFGLIHLADLCIVEGTQITMADGTQKKIEDVKVGDYVKVFNHATGKFDTSVVVANVHENEGPRYSNIINLVFDNGTTSRIALEHGFFDVERNEYVYINESNYQSMIGRKFYTYDGTPTKLVNAYITYEYVRLYSPVTYKHLNIVSDGLLSIGGRINGIFNIFELNDDMTINIEKMNQDIEKYGLFTYEEWAQYLTKEQFDAFNVKYLKVSIGKGLVTKEEIIGYILSYL